MCYMKVLFWWLVWKYIYWGTINYPNLSRAFRQLGEHPELKDRVSDSSDPLTMAYELTPWLPLANAFKVDLLAEDDGEAIVDKLEQYLLNMSRQTD